MALAARRAHETGRLGTVALIAGAVLAGAVVGWAAAGSGPLITFGALLALALAMLSLRSIWVPYGALLAVATLAPFIVLPISAGGGRPTLFEITAVGLIALYLTLFFVDRRERLIVRAEVVLWALFLSYLVFAFVLGSRFGAGSDLVRLFIRFGIGFTLFWITVQLVRTRQLALRLIEWIVAGMTGAATIALALYAGGPSVTFRALIRLVPYGYPDTRVVRFIEDNPGNAMRAVGTGVDPNALGGMLMLGFVLAVGLLFSDNRRLPIVIHLAAPAIIGLAILLTFSRGAWVGAATGAAIIVWFRARNLVPFGLAAGLVALVIGVGATFIRRLEAGLRLEDAATLQRFEEYENAMRIIRAHPWFGIGFGDAPSPEFGVGVSSIYLLIAEQTGLVGLGIFLLLVGVVARRCWGAFRASDDDLLLAVGAAFAAALTVGLVDHYFFNIRFVHTVGLFWILVGLVVALSDPTVRSGELEGESA